MTEERAQPLSPSPAEPARAEVGRPGSFVAGCAIGLCVLLGVGTVVAWRAKKAEDTKRETTLRRLESLSTMVRARNNANSPPPRANGTGEDWTGIHSLEGPDRKVEGTILVDAIDHVLGFETRRYETLDGWGNPIRYRCPGPVHRKGWDFYSCGPNGKDDEGTFDDLIVGEDIAPAASR